MNEEPTPTDALPWSLLIRRLRSYAIFTLTPDRILDSWNAGVEVLLGYTEDEFVGRHGDMIFTDEDRRNEAPRVEMEAALETGEGRDDRWHVRKDGTMVWVNGLMTPVLNDAGEVVGYMKVLRNETVRHEAEQNLERRVREQTAIADLGSYALEARSLDPILDRATELVRDALDVDHVHILELDRRADRLVVRTGTGADGDDRPVSRFHVSDWTMENLLDPRSESARLGGEGADAWEEAWVEQDGALRERGIGSAVCARIRGRGRPFGLIEAVSERPLVFSAADAQFLRSVAHILANAVEQHRLNEELAHRAEHDPLTGLPNRKVFENQLEAALQQSSRSGEKVAVLFLDLDRFKNVNDSLGHEAGDEILKSVACRLREAVRSWDTVARLGGDEFVLLLPNVPDDAEVAHVCERLLAAFERPFAVADREVMVHTTIGASIHPNDGDDVSTLLRAADTAMYDGKSSHRSTFHFYTAAQNALATERLRLENDLRRAIDSDEFELDYQPQIDLRKDAVISAEALLRWRHPQRGRLSPGEFLSTAEGIGLTVPIGEWMMGEAFRQRRRWQEDAGAAPRVAINIATAHFMQPTFPAVLEAIARESGIDPSGVDVEITESAILRDPDLVTRHVEALKALGTTVTLDDFGTGYSSLMYLRTLPIARLKVDETFTHGLEREDTTAFAFVEAIVLLADKLNVTVIMEGVETKGQLDAVRRLGCRCAQGHFVSSPLTGDAFLDFLREHPGR